MGLKRRRFSRDFKLQVLYEIEGGKSIVQASREHQIQPSLISKWHKQQRQYQERAFGGNGNTYTYEARIAELERMVGQLTMENALLKKALQRLEGQVRLGRIGGGK
jgi:transposase-like protein